MPKVTTNTNLIINETIESSKTISPSSVKKVGKPKGFTKAEIYTTDREKIIDTLEKILGLTKENRYFCVNDIDKHKDKVDDIISLENDVKKYFNYGGWGYFKGTVQSKPYVSLIKAIYKDMNYKILTTSKTSTDKDGNSYTLTVLKITKKED